MGWESIRTDRWGVQWGVRVSKKADRFQVYKADKGNTDENGERLMETMTDEDVNPYFASRPLVKSEYLCLERCQILGDVSVLYSLGILGIGSHG